MRLSFALRGSAAQRCADVGRSLFQRVLAPAASTDHFAAVEQMYATSREAVKAVDPEAELYLFGSTVSFGFHEKGSDVDFVALNDGDLANGKKLDVSGELQRGIQSEFLGRLGDVVRREHPTWAVNLVRRVRVPVLRVKGGALIDFDITAHRLNGVRNSALLRSYMVQHPLARLVCMVIKQWSKRVGLNMSGEAGCITSYGFNIMVVYYLLRQGVVQFVDPMSLDLAKIPPLPEEIPWRDLTMEEEFDELGSLCMGFLKFYLDDFRPQTDVITLSRGADLFKKTDLNWGVTSSEMGGKAHYHWVIEDPYEVELNVGRHVTPLKLTLLRRHMERARETAFVAAFPSPP